MSTLTKVTQAEGAFYQEKVEHPDEFEKPKFAILIDEQTFSA